MEIKEEFEIIELENNKSNKKSNKKSIFIISLITFITLLLSITLIDYFIILSPSKNINGVIDTLFSKTNNIINDYKGNNTKTIIESGDLTLNTNLNDYEELNGYNLSYDLEYNKDNSTGLLDLSLNNNKEDIDGKIYYNDNKLYIEFPYLISTMIKFSLDESTIIKIDKDTYSKLLNTSSNDIIYILDNIKNIILNNIDSNCLDKKINGLDVIITYDISNEERVKLFNLIIDYILNDSKTLNILKNNFNISSESINKYKDEIINKEKTIYLKIYSNIIGNINKIEFNYDNKNISFELDSNNEIVNINYNVDYDKSSINTILSLETYQNGTSIDGNVKFNMSNDKYVDITLSNISSINDETKVVDISKARSLKELTDTDLNIINKIIKSFSKENK